MDKILSFGPIGGSMGARLKILRQLFLLMSRQEFAKDALWLKLSLMCNGHETFMAAYPGSVLENSYSFVIVS
jgi:hypothetical protein